MFIYIFFTYFPNQYFIYCLAIDEPKVPIFDGFPFCVCLGCIERKLHFHGNGQKGCCDKCGGIVFLAGKTFSFIDIDVMGFDSVFSGKCQIQSWLLIIKCVSLVCIDRQEYGGTKWPIRLPLQGIQTNSEQELLDFSILSAFLCRFYLISLVGKFNGNCKVFVAIWSDMLRVVFQLHI